MKFERIFTPGPWWTASPKEDKGSLLIVSQANESGMVEIVGSVPHMSAPNVNLKRRAGNAYLQAAAPELLHACEFALEFIKKHNPNEHAEYLLEQAIAKALEILS